MKNKFLLIGGFLAFVFLLSSSHTYAQKKQSKLAVAQHYEGGQEKLLADIDAKVIKPPMMKKTRKKGMCTIQIHLKADGTVSRYSIVKQLGYGSGEEALRVVKTLKFKAPGYDNDYNIPVNFK